MSRERAPERSALQDGARVGAQVDAGHPGPVAAQEGGNDGGG